METTAAQLESVSIQTQNEVFSSSFAVVESKSVWEYSLSIKKDETRAEGSRGMLYGRRFSFEGKYATKRFGSIACKRGTNVASTFKVSMVTEWRPKYKVFPQ